MRVSPVSGKSSALPAVALVAVLWLIAILALTTFAVIKLTGLEGSKAVDNIASIQARYLAEMGVAVAANPKVERSDGLLKQYFDDLGGGYEAKYLSEGSKFNINYIILRRDRDLLLNIFSAWGLDLDESMRLCDALFDWVDSDDSKNLNGAEWQDYERMGRVGQPFNRAFYHLDELKLVRGWDLVEQAYPQWKEWLTLWSRGRLLVQETTSERLAAATGSDPARCESLLNGIKGPDGELGTADDKPLTSLNELYTQLGISKIQQNIVQQRLTLADTTTRIESTGFVGGGADNSQRIALRLVVVIGNRSGQPTLLDRSEEIVP